MTNDAFNDLPDTDELPHVDELPAEDEIELIDQAEREADPVGDLPRDQDLSTDDLIQDGALPEDLEHGNMGRHEYEADFAEPGHEDTIDERIRQEIPEEGSDVVPGEVAGDIESGDLR